MTHLDRLAQDYARVMAERDTAVAEVARLKRGYGQELMDTEEQLALALGLREDPDYGYPTGDHTTVTLAAQVRGEVERLRARVREAESEVRKYAEALEYARKDRVWEMKRANEAARLSADARDRAQDVAKDMAAMREYASILERDRSERDKWALDVAARHGISEGVDDPWGAIWALYTNIAKYLDELTAERDRLRAEQQAHEGELGDRRSQMSAVEAERDDLAEDLRGVRGVNVLIGQKTNLIQNTLERQRPVMSLARQLVAAARHSTAPRTPLFELFIAAVDALDGAPETGPTGATPAAAIREQRWWVDEDGEEWLIENDDDVDYWREHCPKGRLVHRLAIDVLPGEATP